MCKVFISGSRNIKNINIDIIERLNNILDKKFHIVLGDANGVDKAVQKFLFDRHYSLVEIYCSGHLCRNNLGGWVSKFIDTKKSGRAFFEAKDKEMANIADYGFVIWDEKSIGSLNNIAELLCRGKKTLVYLYNKREFIDITSENGILSLLFNGSHELKEVVNKKGSIYLQNLILQQGELSNMFS
ncbi:hypothetical protein [Glaesserella parasuis]|uniref:Uncharacterized protein n=1 Tax=Glaesserella parasuis TaxID=738 RepID=A0AAX1M4Q6_GLAPU|nr:hypothetical protein [Glaesserella parasuis]EQA12652.1 hypothetical protein HPSSW140_1148 [Glaesserella parasuis SW140]MCT8727824.1 hypothetical protein [Glaesserella parasuis]MCT8763876.1 hypothetical protein [Glaesserella parasuis]MDE3986865.1 hypothetical protein [Glaesserella parasuis]MDE3996366.1 hypothetical protein [Glaesserella parasuis]